MDVDVFSLSRFFYAGIFRIGYDYYDIIWLMWWCCLIFFCFLFSLYTFFFNFLFSLVSCFSALEISGWAHNLWHLQLTTTNKSKRCDCYFEIKIHSHNSHSHNTKIDAKQSNKITYNFSWLALKTKQRNLYSTIPYYLVDEAATQRVAAG